MRLDGEGERPRRWGETLRRWASRARRRPLSPGAAAGANSGAGNSGANSGAKSGGKSGAAPGELAAAQHESVVTLTCVVERTQALVRQLEAELQSERALMSAKLERLAAENRLLVERLRERQGEAGQPGGATARPGFGRVSPFRRGLRGH